MKLARSGTVALAAAARALEFEGRNLFVASSDGVDCVSRERLSTSSLRLPGAADLQLGNDVAVQPGSASRTRSG